MALGSFATAYLPQSSDHHDIIRRLTALPEMLSVLSKEEAVAKFDLPADRIIVMISTENMTIGTSMHRHDLAALKEPLRKTEQTVPFIVNRVMALPQAPNLRNSMPLCNASGRSVMDQINKNF